MSEWSLQNGSRGLWHHSVLKGIKPFGANMLPIAI